MGFWSLFKAGQKNTGQFVSEHNYKVNLERQIDMCSQTIEQLRKLNVADDRELKLEFFFYANTADKASMFASELGKLNYSVMNKQSAGDKKLFVVTGWTTKMRMTDAIIKGWSKQMCELGYKFDCDFDGWGTNPTQ